MPVMSASKENVSLFEIFGPVMIGPSSSHTAGVARIAFLSRGMFGQAPAKAAVRFYGSLASTWKGHGSDGAVIAGLLGISPEDEALNRGQELLRELQAQGQGFPIELIPVFESPPSWHPNSLEIELIGKEEPDSKSSGHKNPGLPARLRIRASSIGGGSIRIDEIDGYQVSLSGDLDAIVVLHHDEVGVIAMVSQFLAAHRINIAGTSSHRKGKGQEAMLVVETDGLIPEEVAAVIRGLPPVYQVWLLSQRVTGEEGL